MVAPFLEAARYRACASRRAYIVSGFGLSALRFAVSGFGLSALRFAVSGFGLSALRFARSAYDTPALLIWNGTLLTTPMISDDHR